MSDIERNEDKVTGSETSIIGGSIGCSRQPTTCDHKNPVCTCNTSDNERANFLGQYLDALAENGWSNVQLMPLGEEGKNPVITGRCRLDSDEARSLLVDRTEAIKLIEQDGARGFYLYPGKAEHNTERLVFLDRDKPEKWPSTPSTLRVVSGSGTSDHLTYRNAGDISNADGKNELDKAGSVQAHNRGVVAPGSIHPSGGIYHVQSNSLIETLESDDLPAELQPGSGQSSNSDSTLPEFDIEVPNSIGDIEVDFNAQNRYQIMLNSAKSEIIKAIARGNLRETRFENDRHEAEGWFAEQVGFYMGRDREVIDQVLMSIFTQNPETDAHTDNPDKSSRRKYLEIEKHRKQVLDYATSKNSEYDPGLGIQKITRSDRPEVSYPTVLRVQDALSDLVLASKSEIVEHDRVDRSESQVYRALRKMMDSDDVPFNVETVKDGRRRYYFLETHSILIPKERREELGIVVGF